MPAFTFEKISSPVSADPVPAVPRKAAVQTPRRLIVQMLDRFAVARMQRDEFVANPDLPRKRPPPD